MVTPVTGPDARAHRSNEVPGLSRSLLLLPVQPKSLGWGGDSISFESEGVSSSAVSNFRLMDCSQCFSLPGILQAGIDWVVTSPPEDLPNPDQPPAYFTGRSLSSADRVP